jgi:hypothetical protein
MDDYLIISDYKSPDEIIHLFDKNTFRYLASTAPRGQGPGEIVELGHIAIDEANHIFQVIDYGKYQVFGYHPDSVLANPHYIPEVKMKMNERMFPNRYHYIHDTLCIGTIIEPVGNSDFKPAVGKWNMLTGEIELMKYEHPEIKKKRISFAASMEHGIYVECYNHHDLMTICTLDGELKYNIYGRRWDSQVSNRMLYYGYGVGFCGDRIVALYAGDKNFIIDDETGKVAGTNPSKLLVFDLQGNYIRTLETGCNLNYFCYDKENNRLILTMNDDIQVGYLDLNEVEI